MSPSIACGLCGARFDPEAEVACGSCPMSGACTLACCPECGYTTVDVGSSRSAGFLARVFPSRKPSGEVGATLDGAVVGGRVSIVGFDGEMSTGHRELLRTYGLEPGRTVRVEQHAPVTVVKVDQTEVALEADLAKLVFVGAIR